VYTPVRRTPRALPQRSKINSVAAALTLAIVCACRSRYPVGHLSVRTVDANNQPVAGVAADLFKLTPQGRVYWRASRTGGNGVAIFAEKTGVIEGRYIVRVSLMPYQMMPPGETNERSLTLKRGVDTVITFRVFARRPVRFSPRAQ
jgi:hypothetical protein